VNLVATFAAENDTGEAGGSSGFAGIKEKEGIPAQLSVILHLR